MRNACVHSTPAALCVKRNFNLFCNLHDPPLFSIISPLLYNQMFAVIRNLCYNLI